MKAQCLKPSASMRRWQATSGPSGSSMSARCWKNCLRFSNGPGRKMMPGRRAERRARSRARAPDGDREGAENPASKRALLSGDTGRIGVIALAPLAAKPCLQPVEIEIDDRGREQSEHLAECKPAHHGIAEWL